MVYCAPALPSGLTLVYTSADSSREIKKQNKTHNNNNNSNNNDNDDNNNDLAADITFYHLEMIKSLCAKQVFWRLVLHKRRADKQRPL